MGLCLGKAVAVRATRVRSIREDTNIGAEATSSETTPVYPDTHLHDLPDECIIEIIRRVGNAPLPISCDHHDDMTVQHPLQCALVCKRWSSLIDDAIGALHMRDVRLTDALVQHVGTRFHHLTALTFAPLHTVSGEPLVVLASLTPQVEHLELPGGFESSLPALAQSLIQWTSLKRLNLGNHLWTQNNDEIKIALDALCTLTSLSHLSFSYFEADLSLLCERVGELTNLTSLQLASSFVPPAVPGNLPGTLRELVLRGFKGAALPDSLGLLTSLESLCVEWCKELTAVPESLGRLSRLTKLDIIDCRRLATLPNTLGELESLKVLQVTRFDSMQEWPESFGKLRSLETLVLAGCVELPRALGQLTGLQYLRIDNFKRLPTDIGDLPRLRKLELSYGYGVFEMPYTLGRLSSLQVLRLQFCPSLAVLPMAIGMLTALKELDILKCGNQLEALPESLKHLTQLEVCKISGLPCLRQLPEGICDWKMLTKLEVSHCRSLRSLPEGLGQLSAVKELEISQCLSLASLPESIGALSCLQVLRIRACERLTKLPETLGELNELRVLEIWRCNALEPLPESLRRLSLQFDLSWF